MATTSAFSPSSEQNIPLRRLPSSGSSKYTPSILTNPFSDTNSIASTEDDRSSINHSLLPHQNPNLAASWKPKISLRIDSLGKPALALPTPIAQLEIDIFSAENGQKMFSSVRPERRSGSCSLFAAVPNVEEERGRELSSTTYFFGPGRHPVVRIHYSGSDSSSQTADKVDEFQILKNSVWNRSHGFASDRWGKFEWRYAGRAERRLFTQLDTRKREVNTLLVLEKIVDGKQAGKGKGEKKVRVAMLIRGEGTRTPGTKASDAGNGGILEICLPGVGEDGEENDNLIDEVTVLVTCLVMLKKEVDRMRTRRIAAIGAVAGAV